MGPKNDEVGIVGDSAFRDLVAHWSFLNQPMDRLILNELIGCKVLQLVSRPSLHFGHSISKIALPDAELDRVGKLDHIKQKQFAIDQLLQLIDCELFLLYVVEFSNAIKLSDTGKAPLLMLCPKCRLLGEKPVGEPYTRSIR